MRSIAGTAEMRLRGSDFRRLSGDARDPALQEARAYLAETLESLRHGGDPVDTLVLLRGLRGTAYARRANQRQALDGVGRWLEQRLQREPAISVERLRLELGWLRRMVIAQGKHGEPARRAPGDNRPFGRDIGRLRQDRERALRAGRRRSEPAAPEQRDRGDRGHPAPAAPTELPEAFAVFFADIQAVRKARRKVKERAKERKQAGKAGEAGKAGKAGKQVAPPRDRLLALRPVDPALAPLAANLGCYLLATEGMDELFAATDAQGGVPPSFHVRRAEITTRDGKQIAQRIRLAPPAPPREA